MVVKNPGGDKSFPGIPALLLRSFLLMVNEVVLFQKHHFLCLLVFS